MYCFIVGCCMRTIHLNCFFLLRDWIVLIFTSVKKIHCISTLRCATCVLLRKTPIHCSFMGVFDHQNCIRLGVDFEINFNTFTDLETLLFLFYRDNLSARKCLWIWLMFRICFVKQEMKILNADLSTKLVKG